MAVKEKTKNTLIDGSKLLIESFVQSGADIYIGYPITPTNLFYSNAKQRFPMFMPGPDEITVLQWMAGFSASGKIPVSGSAFPGIALMVESIGMAFMMELPMVIILSQRLGPSTGSATTGAQGDLALLNGFISGGYNIPVFCPSNFEDCWTLANKAVKTAIEFRTPVFILTSKEMVMTSKSFDLSKLPPLEKYENKDAKVKGEYKPYKPGDDLIPPFIALGSDEHQVRLNASTHDYEGMIKKDSPEALENSLRLKEKFDSRMDEITFFELDEDEEAKQLIVTYGISTDATKDAVKELREKGIKVSLLVVKTMLPVPPKLVTIMRCYQKLVFVEENISGILQEIIFGKASKGEVQSVNKFGSMITPEEIVRELS